MSQLICFKVLYIKQRLLTKMKLTLSQKLISWSQLIVFGMMNFVVFLTNSWTTLDLNHIIVDNLNVKESQMSTIASFMYSSFFYGMLCSSFVWPIIVKYISKRNCIILAFIIVGFLNLSCFYVINIYYIILVRFLGGVAQNIHTVGKDFLFDEFSNEYAKSGLIMDSIFGLLGNHDYKTDLNPFYINNFIKVDH